MTLVYKTLRGGRFHRSPDCPGIADGHAKAASEGFPNYPVAPVELLDVDAEVTPCTRCWGPAFQADRWLASHLKAELVADSPYELDFYDGVLRRVEGLDPDYVRVQHQAVGSSGLTYRVDFAILRPGRPQIAIEIDGFQKDKSRNEADEARQSSVSQRQNDLTSVGWVVLRFTNRQVSTTPSQCRADIENTLGRPATDAATRASPHSLDRDTAGTPQIVKETTHTRKSPSARVLVGLVAVSFLVVTVLVMVVLQLTAGDDGAGVAPSGFDCPEGHTVKANQSGIYHEPGWEFYDKTRPEVCFANADDAEAAGYRASKVQ